jgi:hypothetical protein
MMTMTDQQNIFFNRASQFAIQARQAGERASIYGGIGKLGGTIFSNREGIAGVF